MKREEIEKAAMLSCASKDEVLTDFGSNCFIEGAQWRINSVWHAPTERPDNNRPFLHEWYGRGMHMFSVDYVFPSEDWAVTTARCSTVRWAYVNDLLPDGKEEAETTGAINDGTTELPKTGSIDVKESSTDIDWEYRRYEVAKDMIATLFQIGGYKELMQCVYHDDGNSNPYQGFAKISVQVADALIAELKKGGGK